MATKKVTQPETAEELKPETEPAIEETTQPETVEEKPVNCELPSPKESACRYPTEFYKTSGIPFCEACGEKLRNRLDGSPICPEKRKDCPRTV